MAVRAAEYTIGLDTAEARANYTAFAKAVADGSVQLRGEFTEMSNTLVNATGKLEVHGSEMNRLKNYIREERQERRMQNFMMRESREAIGAIALALSGFSMGSAHGSEEAKKFSGALTEGFMAFQGFSFILSAVPFGNFIAGALGAAAAMVKLSEGSDEAKASYLTQTDQLDRLIKKYEEWNNKVLQGTPAATKVTQEEAKALNARAREYDEFVKIVTEGTTKKDRVLGFSVDMPVKGVMALEEAMKRLPAAARAYQDAVGKALAEGKSKSEAATEGLKALTDESHNLQVQAKGASAALNEMVVTAGKSVELGKPGKWDFLQNAFETIADYRDERQNEWEKKYLRSLRTMHAVSVAETKKELLEIGSEWDAFFSSMDAGVGAVVQEVGVGMKSAFEETFGEANSLLEKFFEAVLVSMAEIAARQAAAAGVAGLLSLLTGGSLEFAAVFGKLGGIFHEGGRVPRAHGGMYIDAPAYKQFPIIVRGGETIRTERQEAGVQSALRGDATGTQELLRELRAVKMAIRQNRPVLYAGGVVSPEEIVAENLTTAERRRARRIK